MLWTIALLTLCTSGVGFYIRFLLALCKERSPDPSGYWMLLRLRFEENTVVADPPQSIVSHAA